MNTDTTSCPPLAEPSADSPPYRTVNLQKQARLYPLEPPSWAKAIEGLPLTLWLPLRIASTDDGWSFQQPLPSHRTSLEVWLTTLPPGRRLWHATRAALLTGLFLEQWRTALSNAGLEPFVPPIHGGHLRVEPVSERIWLGLRSLLLGLKTADPYSRGAELFFPLSAQERLYTAIGFPPEQLLSQGTSFEAAAVWAMGLVLLTLVDAQCLKPQVSGDGLRQLEIMQRGNFHVSNSSQLPGAPDELSRLVRLMLSPEPQRRPGLLDAQLQLMQLLGAQDPPWLHLPLDRVLEWLRDRGSRNDLTEIGLLFALRPELAASPVVQRHIEDHLAERLLTPLLPNSRTPLTHLHITLLKSLPGLVPHLVGLMRHPHNRNRLTLIDILGAYRSAEAVGALMEVINSTHHDEAWAAREAIARTPQLPIAWDTQHLRLIPCSVAWEQMTPREDDKNIRTCTNCRHPVVHAESLDALHQIAATGACAAFSPQDTLTLNFNNNLVYLLKTGQSFTLGSDLRDDLRIPELPPRAAILHVHQKQLRLTPLQRHHDLPGSPVTLAWDSDLPDATRELRVGQLVLTAQSHGFFLNLVPQQPDLLRFPIAGSPIPPPRTTEASVPYARSLHNPAVRPTQPAGPQDTPPPPASDDSNK